MTELPEADCTVPQNNGALVYGIETYVSELVSKVIDREPVGSLYASTALATSLPAAHVNNSSPQRKRLADLE